jgi:hypothetical protein
MVSLLVTDPNSLTATLGLRPGVGPLQIEVRSSNPAAGTIVGSPARITADSSTASVEFKPSGVGETDVTPALLPPGFSASPLSGKLTFAVSAPGFETVKLLLGKDTTGASSATLLSYVTPPESNVTVTLTSADPSRLLLSRNADSPAGPSLTSTLIAGQRSIGGFLIHALANNGVVPIKITAPGYSDSVLSIALTDTVFSFNASFVSNSPIRAVVQNGPQLLRVVAAPSLKNVPDGYIYVSQGFIRPGAPDIALTVNSSDPAVLAVDNPRLVFSAGMSSAQFNYVALSPGLATLSLEVPGGYLRDPALGQLNFSEEGGKLMVTSSVQIGRDLQTAVSISAEGSFQQPALVTVSSSDPSRLLVSASETAAGQATVTVSMQPNLGLRVFLQSLSGNGSPIVTVSADGYQSTTLPVTLTPAAAVFQADVNSFNLFTNSAPQRLTAGLAPLDPATLRPGQYQPLRPGVSFSLPVTVSDSKILAVTPASLQFSADARPTVDVRPLTIGTAIVSLGLPPSGATPASGRQVVFNVTEPDLFIPNFSLGIDLQVPVQVTLAGRLPAPSSDVTVNVSSSFPIAISNNPASPGGYFISVVIPAGQHLSKPFYVQGLSATGTGSLQLFSGNYSPSQSTVTLTKTAFVFKEASQPQPIKAVVGSPLTLTVAPALLPLGTPALAPLTFRGGVSPLTFYVGWQNAGTAPLLTVDNDRVVFQPGDQQAAVTARPTGPGNVRMTLFTKQTYPYEFETAQSVLQISIAAK